MRILIGIVASSTSSVTDTISIEDFGAVGDGITDNLTAIRNALAEGASTGKTVVVPTGIFAHSDTLDVDGIRLMGSGQNSQLFATDPSECAVKLLGDGASLYNLKLTTINSERFSTTDSCKVLVDHATNFSIENVWIERAGSAGIFCLAASNGEIINNTIRLTKADSIHITNDTVDETIVSHDILVDGNRIEYSGDDGVGIVTYETLNVACFNITVQNNTALYHMFGRGYTVVGGHDVEILNNHFLGGFANVAGIYLAAESSFNTAPAWNILVQGNTLKDAGSTTTHGAITVFNGQTAEYVNHDITINNNSIFLPRKIGILITGGSNNDGIDITNNKVYDAPFDDIFLENSPQNVTQSGNEDLLEEDYLGDVVPANGGATPEDPIDFIIDTISGVIAAWSTTRLLRENYTGFSMKVRRESDDATFEAGFLGYLSQVADIDDFLDVTASTGAIEVLFDQSGNDLDAVQVTTANQPVLELESFADNPALVFDGVNDEFVVGDTELHSNTNGMTIIAVVNSDATGDVIIGKVNASTNEREWALESNRFFVREDPTQAPPNESAAFTHVLGMQILRGWWSPGGQAQIFRNGTLMATAINNVTDISDTTTPVRIGATASGSQFAGEIYEIIVWSRKLNSSEAGFVERQLSRQYGILLTS